MRLIDADELLKGKTDHEMISTHLIFNAPTVDVLDKIRAEIVEIVINAQIDEHTSFIRTGDNVKKIALDVIDKYR